jgi:NAD(P)-dependent dehydrogenase (short-subunit alcohol dehydrogenase family)
MGLEMFDLTGKVALVSGAANGLGKAMATAVAEAGADVLIVDIEEAGLEKTASELSALGRKVIPQICNIDEISAIDRLFDTLDKEFGRIDYLGNVAGNAHREDPLSISIDQVQIGLQSLVVGRFYMCQQAGKRMIAQGKGSIVNIGSLASLNALGRGSVAYSMAMGAVIQMTRELSTEWSGRGVRVNAILPGQVMNKGLSDWIKKDPKMEQVFLRGLPIGRMGRPDDIKGLSVLLASDASSFITGALIPMDGGNLAKNAGGSHFGFER